MNKKYLISILGTQTVDGQEDKTELTVPCSYEIKDDAVYISYEEYEDGNIHKKSMSTIKIDNTGMVILLREGIQNVKLTLEKEKRHLCHYSTEFGDIIIGVFTRDIKCNFEENQCKIELYYVLDVNTEHLSVNEVIINVKEI